MTGTDFKDLFRNIEKRENPNYENVEEGLTYSYYSICEFGTSYWILIRISALLCLVHIVIDKKYSTEADKGFVITKTLSSFDCGRKRSGQGWTVSGPETTKTIPALRKLAHVYHLRINMLTF